MGALLLIIRAFVYPRHHHFVPRLKPSAAGRPRKQTSYADEDLACLAPDFHRQRPRVEAGRRLRHGSSAVDCHQSSSSCWAGRAAIVRAGRRRLRTLGQPGQIRRNPRPRGRAMQEQAGSSRRQADGLRESRPLSPASTSAPGIVHFARSLPPSASCRGGDLFSREPAISSPVTASRSHWLLPYASPALEWPGRTSRAPRVHQHPTARVAPRPIEHPEEPAMRRDAPRRSSWCSTHSTRLPSSRRSSQWPKSTPVFSSDLTLADLTAYRGKGARRSPRRLLAQATASAAWGRHLPAAPPVSQIAKLVEPADLGRDPGAAMNTPAARLYHQGREAGLRQPAIRYLHRSRFRPPCRGACSMTLSPRHAA